MSDKHAKTGEKGHNVGHAIPRFCGVALADRRENDGQMVGNMPTVQGTFLDYVMGLPEEVIVDDGALAEVVDNLIDRTQLEVTGEVKLARWLLAKAIRGAVENREFIFWRAKAGVWTRYRGAYVDKRDYDLARAQGVLKDTGTETDWEGWRRVLDALRTDDCPYLGSGNRVIQLVGYDRKGDGALLDANHTQVDTARTSTVTRVKARRPSEPTQTQLVLMGS